MLYIHRFSIFDNPDTSSQNNNIPLLEVRHSLQEGNIKLSEMQRALDQGNKSLVETNKKISEMRQLLLQGQMLIGKNITTPLEFSPPAQEFSYNL